MLNTIKNEPIAIRIWTVPGGNFGHYDDLFKEILANKALLFPWLYFWQAIMNYEGIVSIE